MKKIYTLVIALLFCTQFLAAQMVLKYKIDQANTTVKLPFHGIVNVIVDWGDEMAKDTFKTAGNKQHTYLKTGIYKVSVEGKLTGFGVDQTPQKNLINVESWDGLGLSSLAYAFFGAENLQSVPSNLPSTVNDIKSMFQYATSFNQPIDSWNTVNITNMSGIFMFTTSFNQPIGTWNTTNVTDMSGMFFYAFSFNQPIGTWNTTNVSNMSEMFSSAISFNQPIGTWNTTNVENMNYMFYKATSFNQPVGAWNTTNVKSMSSMFHYATTFNQPIGTWSIKNVTSCTNIFNKTSLCTEYYDNLLNGWSSQVVKSGVNFDGGNSKYSLASAASRATLKSKAWIIYDAGQGIDNTKCSLLSTEVEQENTSLQKINIYPNPSTGLFTISCKMLLNTIRIYDAGGTLLYDQLPTSTEQIIDLSAAKSGLYLLQAGNQSVTLMKE